jgi:ATP-binding cassette, subfamily B, bacterial
MTDDATTRHLLRRFVWPYRWPMGLAVAIVLAETMTTLVQPWPLLLAVDNAIGHRPIQGPLGPLLRPVQARGTLALGGVSAGAEVGLAVIGALLGYLATYLTGAVSERIGADLRAAVSARLLRLSLRFHDSSRTGDLVTRLTGDVSRVEDALVSWVVTLLPEVLSLVGILVILLWIDPLMAATGLAVTPLLALVSILRRRAVRPVQRRSRDEQGRLTSHLTEMLGNVRAVQSFAQEREALRRFVVRNQAATESNLAALDVTARYSPLADVVLAVGAGLVIWLGVARVSSGGMTVGLFLVVVSYLVNLYGPIRSLTSLSAALAKRAISQARLVEILTSEEVIREDRRAHPFEGVREAICFRDVSFGYRPGAPVIEGLSLRVPAGTTLAVVGPSGAGKSTLLSLLLRLYDPEQGAIEVDGTDLRRLRLASLRERIALVPQDPWLMDGSIRDNIVFGRPGASDDEVLVAARLALVDEFAGRLPQGYDSPVGERGGFLSGGQKRRLAIARALLRDSPILLLDEPTTGLDADAEAEAIRAIRLASRGRTVILVTHSVRLASAADRVAVLRDGAIAEQGTPAELALLGGLYQHLRELQLPVSAGGRSEAHGSGRRGRRVATA